MLLLLLVQRRAGEILAVFRSPGVLLTLTVTTLLISMNWLTYIWAVVTERIIQASLGYYINPLVTVFLAMIFLREKINRLQALSIALAGVGVAFLLWQKGELPWIALVLAFSFGFYSLLRKQVGAEAETGLLIETALLAPWVLIFLGRSELLGEGAFGSRGLHTDLLLLASGLITALPLVLFTYGARRLELVTVGFVQFSAPTLQFLLAVGLYGEPFTRVHVVTFVFIWSALALFLWDLHTRWRKARLEPRPR